MDSRRQEVGAWSSRRLNIFVICDLFQSPVWASEGRSGINCDFKRIQNYNKIDYKGSFKQCDGDVAQMVERSLSMREVRGSIPRISKFFFFFSLFCFRFCFRYNVWENRRDCVGGVILEKRKWRGLSLLILFQDNFFSYKILLILFQDNIYFFFLIKYLY